MSRVVPGWRRGDKLVQGTILSIANPYASYRMRPSCGPGVS